MALQITTNIDVDFYDKKYILINAKQNDKYSRFLSVTCYNHGTLFTLNKEIHSAYIRYKKADDYSVLDSCIINEGKVIVELTEQMLAVSGICYADLIIIEGGNAKFDNYTGKLTGVEDSSILSTMTFRIDVSEVAVENSEIESNYNFDSLNEALDELNAGYEDVIVTARKWAIGDETVEDNGDGLETPSNTNSAYYWCKQAQAAAVGQVSVVTGIQFPDSSDYKNGQVSIDAKKVGAIPTSDIATVDEIKDFLGI